MQELTYTSISLEDLDDILVKLIKQQPPKRFIVYGVGSEIMKQFDEAMKAELECQKQKKK